MHQRLSCSRTLALTSSDISISSLSHGQGMLMVQPSLSMSKSGLARLWAHEALRVFHDRLVTHDDKMRCRTLLAEAAAKHLPNLVLEHGPLGITHHVCRLCQYTAYADKRAYVQGGVLLTCMGKNLCLLQCSCMSTAYSSTRQTY